MRLLEVKFSRSYGKGTFVEAIDLDLTRPRRERGFHPLCLLGRNGSGKSHFLQALAESFQSVWHECSSEEERESFDDGMDFRIVYSLAGHNGAEIAIERTGPKEQRRVTVNKRFHRPGEWEEISLTHPDATLNLPTRIVGYTSGGNETLSVPFHASTLKYSLAVLSMAREDPLRQTEVPEPRLLLIDYSTHLEMLVANLLLGSEEQRRYLLKKLPVTDLRSFRCVLQGKRVDLTEELKAIVEALTRCATAWQYSPDTQTHTFDFWVSQETRKAFASFFNSPFECYGAFHKLSLLNAIAIPQASRTRFSNAINRSRFAARLPEPTDEEKIFRFEQVTFQSRDNVPGRPDVDYVALSDGEHQLVQVLGLFTMIDDPNALFLLDEAESHFNPGWRTQFLRFLLDTPTRRGTRRSGDVADQEALLTTHAPFLPSDMPMTQVMIFETDEERHLTIRPPRQQTYGASYEEILQDCFGIDPPISEESMSEIDAALASNDPEDAKRTLGRIGYSVEKGFLEDHLRQISKDKRKNAVRPAK